MKLVHINLNEAILVDAIHCTEWVIESPEYFSEYVMELADQVEGKEGRFVLSDNEKEADISKNVELIFNIFALDINERKLISKLYMELEKLTADERFYVKTQEMKQLRPAAQRVGQQTLVPAMGQRSGPRPLHPHARPMRGSHRP